MKPRYRVLIMPTKSPSEALRAPWKSRTLAEWVDRKRGNGSHLIGFTRNTDQSNFIIKLTDKIQ